ncbi:MAG: signal peptidase I [Actinomycetota bacterium]
MRRILKILGSITLVATALVGWLFFAPEPLGGRVSYVVTTGSSMQPGIHAGDLVVVRESAGYEVGDIAGYHSDSLDRVVLHRIVAEDADGFVFKGDNNDFIDQDHPAPDQILGAAWLVIPRAGRALTWVGKPGNAALIVAVLAVVLLGGFARSRRRRGRHRTPGRAGHQTEPARRRLRGASAIAAVTMIISLALGAFAYTRPIRVTTTRTSAYENAGTFSYSATTDKSAVYPSGTVTTGRPLFLKLVDEVEVRFDYMFSSSEPHVVDGEGELMVELWEPSGWKHNFVIATTRDLDGDRVRLAGTLDLRKVRSLMGRFGALTQVQQQAFRLTVIPQLRIDGAIRGRSFGRVFAPTLRFELDPLRMRLAAPEPGPLGSASAADPLAPRARGTVAVPTTVRNELSIGPLAVPVSTLRIVAAIGAGIALLIALAGLIGRRDVDEPAAITRRYGSLILDIASASATSERKAVQVKDMGELVRLAQGYERFILHDQSENVHTYSVEEDGVVYWYQPAMPDASNVTELPIVRAEGTFRSPRADDLARRRSQQSR